MKDKLSTLRAAWPVLRSAIRRGQLFRPQCELVPPDGDIEATYDLEIPMAEGFSLTANVFHSRRRRAAGAADPVVMCAHPYDNHLLPALGKTPLGGPVQQYRLLPQAGSKPRFSTLTSWESPDPGFWVPAGYTLVNLNLPGFANSGGPASVMSAHQGECYRQAIAYVGAQGWCDGNVGLCGVSFLCISQYLAAATPEGSTAPEALKCMIPWEGVSDMYQDLACRGGVADVGFLDFWWHTEVKESLNVSLDEYRAEEEAVPLEALSLHPYYDDYWKAKAPPLENIRVPMLVCASFSDHELHTFGSFRAFEQAGSQQKWLYTHRGGKWGMFYRPESLRLQKEFMDHFLKGEANGFNERPKVRIEVRTSRDEIREVRWEDAWPLAGSAYKPLYLNESSTLSERPPELSAEVTYEGRAGHVCFDYVFEEDTEITGYAKLKVWVEVRAASSGGSVPEDLVLCCFLDKRDAAGQSVRFFGSVGQEQDMITRGYGRAARRELNETVSRPFHPVPLAARDQPLSHGEIVPVEIAFCPSSTFFLRGEALRLIVSATDIVHAPIFKKDTGVNRGTHVLHLGGRFDSHVLLPRVSR